jgi:hypothetical protein
MRQADQIGQLLAIANFYNMLADTDLDEARATIAATAAAKPMKEGDGDVSMAGTDAVESQAHQPAWFAAAQYFLNPMNVSNLSNRIAEALKLTRAYDPNLPANSPASLAAAAATAAGLQNRNAAAESRNMGLGGQAVGPITIAGAVSAAQRVEAPPPPPLVGPDGKPVPQPPVHPSSQVAPLHLPFVNVASASNPPAEAAKSPTEAYALLAGVQPFPYPLPRPSLLLHDVRGRTLGLALGDPRVPLPRSSSSAAAGASAPDLHVSHAWLDSVSLSENPYQTEQVRINWALSQHAN